MKEKTVIFILVTFKRRRIRKDYININKNKKMRLKKKEQNKHYHQLYYSKQKLLKATMSTPGGKQSQIMMMIPKTLIMFKNSIKISEEINSTISINRMMHYLSYCIKYTTYSPSQLLVFISLYLSITHLVGTIHSINISHLT